MLLIVRNEFAPVAQLDRVLASEARGRGFESRRARQFFQRVTTFLEISEVLRARPVPNPCPRVWRDISLAVTNPFKSFALS